MPEYDYEVIDRGGRLLKGQAEAESVTDLVRGLSAEGHTVVDVAERKAAGRAAFRRRSRLPDQVVAFHELATLLESGVSLPDAVLAQARGSPHPELASAFDAIARSLQRGRSFHDSLHAGGLSLPRYVHHLVEAGEASGQLAQALRQAVEQMQYDQRVAADVRSALVYPAVLVVSGFAAVLLVFVFVVPQFADLLDDADALPLLAEAVLRTGVWFNESGWLLAPVLAAAAALVAALSRQAGARQRARDFLAALPVLGSWLSESDTARWASVMSALVASRVGLMEALDLAARGAGVTRRRAALEQAAGDVRGGTPLSEALERRSALTPAGYNLVRVGEQSGRLSEMLRALATLHEENSKRRMKRVLALIEPVAVLLIGGFLGVIMIGIILAITSVNDIAF